MKVLLVALNSKYTHTNIALYYLKNKIIDICDVDYINLNVNDSLSSNLNKIMNYSPEVVCFGVYIWNLEETLKLASDIKRINPNTIIAFGGPEVSYNSDELLNKHNFIDSILISESENNIVKFIEDIKTNTLNKTYNIVVEAKDIPSIADDIVNDYDNRIIYFETSRGCPYNCSYCLSCIDKRVRYFDLTEVKKDLKKILDINPTQIRFIDRTFNSDKERALDIWKFLLKNRRDTEFHFEINPSLIDDNILEFLGDVPSDIFRFEIGVQSTNKKTLESINRNYNFEYEKEIINKLNKIGSIHVHTDLIIGLPHENVETFKKTFNDLYNLNSNELQLGFLKFLKGTDIYKQQEEFDYKYSEYPPYEVLSNSFLSYEEISYLKKFEKVFNYIFNSKMFIQSIKYLITKFNSPYLMYEHLTNYFMDNNLLDKKISYDDIYMHLIKLFDDEVLIQTLTYDYVNNFKGSRDWMYNKYDYKKEINDKKLLKKYKIIILDYNIQTGEKEKTIYKIEK